MKKSPGVGASGLFVFVFCSFPLMEKDKAFFKFSLLISIPKVIIY